MNLRLLIYFFATFFTSLSAGVSEQMSNEQWVRLIGMSLGAGFTAVVAYLDRSSGGPGTRAALVAVVVFLAVSVSGCSITVYGPNGQPQLRSYANTKALHWRGPGTELDIQEADNSTPTKAATAGVTSGITAAGAAAAGLR